MPKQSSSHVTLAGFMRDFIGLQGLPALAAYDRLPIRSLDPDIGLFGPTSVTWEIFREPLLLAGGAAAVLMQVAHPAVSQGVEDHSSYDTDPWGRLERTLDWLNTVAFGTTKEARAACIGIQKMHAKVTGSIAPGRGAGPVSDGATYSALTPSLQRWVLATILWSSVISHDLIMGTLTAQQKDCYVTEWRTVANAMGIPAAGWWSGFDELDAYVADTIASGGACVGAGSRVVARSLLTSPHPSLLPQPVWNALLGVSFRILPAPMRAAYGIRWSRAAQWRLDSALAACRRIRRSMPAALRTSTAYKFAVKRVVPAGPGMRGFAES